MIDGDIKLGDKVRFGDRGCTEVVTTIGKWEDGSIYYRTSRMDGDVSVSTGTYSDRSFRALYRRVEAP